MSFNFKKMLDKLFALSYNPIKPIGKEGNNEKVAHNPHQVQF